MSSLLIPQYITPTITTSALPLITTSLRYVLVLAGTPTVEVASILYSAPHPVRSVVWPGLLRKNYIFKLYQNTGAGTPTGNTPGSAANDTVQVVDSYSFNPDNSSYVIREPEKIVVGVDSGWVDGLTSLVLDGTAGKANWIGQNPILLPSGIAPFLQPDDYFWDSLTGLITFVNPLYDGFKMLVEFQAIPITNSPGMPLPVQFNEIFTITADTVLVPGDFGKCYIVAPGVNKITITLPLLSTVNNLMPIYFNTAESGNFNVEIVVNQPLTERIKWNGPNRTIIRLTASQTLTLYKNLPDEWRVSEYSGAGRVGDIFHSYDDTAFGALLLDGSNYDVSTFGRLYNDYVLQLPATATCAYVDWPLNPTKFSLKDTASNNARLPDIRDMHVRNANANPGVPLAANVGATTGQLFGGASSATPIDNTHIPASVAGGFGASQDYQIRNSNDATASRGKFVAGSGENTVKSVYLNTFVSI